MPKMLKILNIHGSRLLNFKILEAAIKIIDVEYILNVFRVLVIVFFFTFNMLFKILKIQ